MGKRILCVAVAALLLGLSALQAGADVILTNLPGTPTTTGTNLGLGTDGANRAKAVALRTGDTPYEFVNMQALISNPTPASTLSGGIFAPAATGTAPGALLAAFADVPVAAGVTNQLTTLSVPGGFTMQPNTTYWFLLDGPNTTNSLLWHTLNPNTAPTASGGNTFVGYSFSSNNNLTWAASTTFNAVTINANPVPEPAAMSLLAGGALLVLRRRR